MFQRDKSITCLAWNPSKASLLFVGSSNGEVNVIKLSGKGVSACSAWRRLGLRFLQAKYDEQWLESLPGWIHAMCFNGNGTQLIVALGNRLLSVFGNGGSFGMSPVIGGEPH